MSSTMPERNLRNIPSEILRTVVTIDSLGSLTKAARKLGLSQPAISTQMKKLSAMIGGPVFDTSGVGTRITPLGMLVLTQAKLFMQANDQILALGGATEKKQPLRLGLPTLYAKGFLKAWEQAGGEDVMITAAYSTVVSASFTEGNLDVVCLTGRPPAELRTPVMEWHEKLAWVRARDFVLSLGKPIPIVALPGSVSDQPMISALEKASLAYRVTFASSDKDARYAAVNSKCGITVLPERFVPDYLAIAREYYLPKLPVVPVSVFVSPDCDADRSAALLQTLKALAPPAAQTELLETKKPVAARHHGLSASRSG
jgi:DNA-binding transcriptional LysR family regulator